MTKAEQYCYEQGRGELKSVMNQLKACREALSDWQKPFIEKLLPTLAYDSTPQSCIYHIEQRTKEECFKAGWGWLLEYGFQDPEKAVQGCEQEEYDAIKDDFEQAIKSAEVK